MINILKIVTVFCTPSTCTILDEWKEESRVIRAACLALGYLTRMNRAGLGQIVFCISRTRFESVLPLIPEFPGPVVPRASPFPVASSSYPSPLLSNFSHCSFLVCPPVYYCQNFLETSLIIPDLIQNFRRII